jgi:hypothetical protein
LVDGNGILKVKLAGTPWDDVVAEQEQKNILQSPVKGGSAKTGPLGSKLSTRFPEKSLTPVEARWAVKVTSISNVSLPTREAGRANQSPV